MSFDVTAVGDDRRLAAAWADVPAALHAGAPGWVPPLRSDVLTGTDRRRNPLHRHAEIEHFLLRRDGRPVGRVAATIHPAWCARQDRPSAFFGFLDAPEDPAAFTILLRAVEQWAGERGQNRVAGPYNYWSGQEIGLLLDHHDERPAAFQTWNPSSYLSLLEAAGYRERTRMTAYRLSGEELARGLAALRTSAARVRATQGLSTRPLSRRRFRADVERIRLLFNQAFAASPEVVPYEADVFASMVHPLRSLLDRDLVRLAERDGQPVAFSLVIPDLNQILAHLHGRLGPLGLLRLPWLRRRVDGAVVLLVGALPGTPLGVGHLLFADTLEALVRGGYREVHTTWVHEENTVMHGLLRGLFGAGPARRWALLERELAA